MGAPVIVAYTRTAVADARRGALANTSIYDLGKAVVTESLKRSGVAAEDIEDLVMGEVLHGGGRRAGQNAVELGLTGGPRPSHLRARVSGRPGGQPASAAPQSRQT